MMPIFKAPGSVRRVLAGAALAAAVAMSASTPAAAETVEEAVAYLVSGMADGATIGASVFKKTKDAPATYEVKRDKPNPHEPRVSIVVTKKTDCIFDVALTMDMGKGGSAKTATLDFSKVGAMDYTGKERVKVTGKDFCKGDIPPACDGRLAVDVTADKFKAAYADMRKTCH